MRGNFALVSGVTVGRRKLFSETLRSIALIDATSVIERILRHLRLSTEAPTPRP